MKDFASMSGATIIQQKLHITIKLIDEDKPPIEFNVARDTTYGAIRLIVREEIKKGYQLGQMYI